MEVLEFLLLRTGTSILGLIHSASVYPVFKNEAFEINSKIFPMRRHNKTCVWS